MPIATSHSKAQKVLAASDINWTYFSPAAYFEPGEPLVDELENPAHERASFSIGY